MKRRWFPVLVIVVALCMTVLDTCSTTPEAEAPKASKAPSFTIEVTGKDGKTTKVDTATLKTVTGKGGFKKSTGTIVGPATFSGVSLDEVLAKAGGITKGDGLEITASDGYTMTLSYEQVQGMLMTYDSKGQALKVKDLDTILITASSDETFGKDLPRLAFPSPDGDLSDGHFWIKQVSKIKFVTGVSNWEIKLSGIESATLDRPTYESLATCGSTPHPALTFETTNKEGVKEVYEGVPLWILVSMVDGGDAKGGHYVFNKDLADKGYTIQVVSKDGFSAEFTSKEVSGNKDILMAYKKDGKPLGEDEGPLKIVGAGLPSKKHGVKQVSEIKLTNLPK